MPQQKLLIAYPPGEGGVREDVKPWMLPDEAFVSMKNIYPLKGEIRKRAGPFLLGRAISDVYELYPAVVNSTDIQFISYPPKLLPIKKKSVRIELSTILYIDDGEGILTGSSGETGIIDYNKGIFTINFSPIGSDDNSVKFSYSFPPSLPAMGIIKQDLIPINDEDSIFFDMRNANQFVSNQAGFRDVTSYAFSQNRTFFRGVDDDFFSGSSYYGSTWISNGLQGTHVQPIANILPGEPTTIIFSGNILEVGDPLYIDDILGTIGTDKVNGLNRKTVFVLTATTTEITISNNTTTLVYEQKGYASVTTRNAGSFISEISNIEADTPTSGSTRIYFAGVIFYIEETEIYLKNIVGTIGEALNNRSFMIDAVGADFIDIEINTLGLVYDSGGIAYNPISDGAKLYLDDSNKGFVNFNPLLGASTALEDGRVLKGGKQFLAYKDTLLIVAPIEGSPYNTNFINHRNRIRYSQIGAPFYTSPVPDNKTFDGFAWRDDVVGRGGFIDLPAEQAIVKIETVKDSVIVFCEQKTWELQFTSNSLLPYIFKKINDEFGAESSFSTVGFNDYVLGVGQKGIISAKPGSASRMDLKIPYKVFDFLDEGGIKRVHMGRDFLEELVFWSFNDATKDSFSEFPNRLLVYNYREDSFSEFVDSFTCFGSFQRKTNLIWEDVSSTWETTAFTWDSAKGQSKFPFLVAGNHAGYFYVLSQRGANPVSLSISDITIDFLAVCKTVSMHNLESGLYVEFFDVGGMVEINGLSTRVEVIDSFNFRCLDINSISFSLYDAGGELSVRTPFQLLSKRFSPFIKNGVGCALQKMSVLHDYSPNGEIKINIYTYQDPQTEAENGNWQDSLVLDDNPTGKIQEKLWSNFIAHVRGDFFQFEITEGVETMLDSSKSTADFILHALMLYVRTAGRVGNF